MDVGAGVRMQANGAAPRRTRPSHGSEAEELCRVSAEHFRTSFRGKKVEQRRQPLALAAIAFRRGFFVEAAAVDEPVCAEGVGEPPEHAVSSTAALTASSMRSTLSVIEYSVCSRRWTKLGKGMAVTTRGSRDFTPGFLRSAPALRRFAGRPRKPRDTDNPC